MEIINLADGLKAPVLKILSIMEIIVNVSILVLGILVLTIILCYISEALNDK